MPRISPFEALVYDADVAGPIERLTAPPYDVISEPRRKMYLDTSPYSIVHLDLGSGAEPLDGDDAERYDEARGLLAEWRRDGVLRRQPASYYAYEMRYADPPGVDRRVRGLLCAMELEAWGGSVLPHEQVMPGPVQDRLRLLRATATHLSAIYGTVDGPCEPLSTALRAATGEPPMFELTDDEGVTHAIWRMRGDAAVAEALRAETLLIADGHHRYTTALAYRQERHEADGPGPWDRVFTFLVDAGTEHLPVQPYHRIQRSGTPPPDGDPVADLESLLAALDDETLRYGTAKPGPDGPAYSLHRLEGAPPTVEALHRQVLDAAAPGDALAFTHTADDADAAVRSGGAVAAYFLPPTTPERIRAVIARGERLPRKSTFFWPKPRTGMALMPLDPP